MFGLILPSRRPAVVAACDAAALTVFVIVGLLSHHGAIRGHDLAVTLIPFLVAWMATAVAVGLYQHPRPAALIVTWLVGITLAVTIRAVLLERTADTEEAAFLPASLVFTLLFVSVPRAALQLSGRRRVSS